MELTDKQKEWIASSIQTFLATFLTVAGTTLSSGIQWSWVFWGSLAMVAVRAAVKAVLAKTPVPILGGVKKNVE
jgi:VIT1/CCC1 family predicted Fe2+/Mn2+ transporter